MEIKIKRHAHGKDSTGGIMTINESFFGYTCEDEHRDIKVMHETCIPVGRYPIKIRNSGGMNVKYSASYPFHKGMLHIQDVPGFEWIYIHVGNTDDDTSGCVLVGRGIRTVNNETTISESVLAYTSIYGLIMLAFERGEEVWIEVE